MTHQQFQDQFQIDYQGDVDTPDYNSDDWNVRKGLLKEGIDSWKDEPGILWAELWKQLDDAADGVKTTAASTLAYNCPTDMDKPLGGWVRLVDSAGNTAWYKVLKSWEAETKRSSGGNICFFTGSYTGAVGGYKLNFLDQPPAGYTIKYPYYKVPTYPSATSDLIEMSNPYFALQIALAKLHEIDGEGDRATLALAKANNMLAGMRVNNYVPAWYQESYVPDEDFEAGTAGFGN